MFRLLICSGAVLAIAGAVAAAESPIDEGSLYLDGSVFFQRQSGELWGDGLTSAGVGNGSFSLQEGFEIGPTVGYFTSPGLFVGGQFAILYYEQGKSNLAAIALGPTVDYFFRTGQGRTEVKGSAYPYIRGFLSWGNLVSGGDVAIWQFGGKGGLLYMLSGAVALDIAARFQGDSWRPDGGLSINGTTVSVGIGVSAFIY